MEIVLLGAHDIASNVALSLLVTAQHRYTIMLSGTVASGLTPVAELEALAAFEQELCDVIERGQDIACQDQPATGRYYSGPRREDIRRLRTPAQPVRR